MTSFLSNLPSLRSALGLSLSTGLASLALSGCAQQTPAATPASAEAKAGTNATVSVAPASCDVAKDRAAILKMSGTFKVTFDFQETESLTKGYVPKEPYHTGATEVVQVIDAETTEKHVVLQHILVLGSGDRAMISKHWRQDWTFEDPEILTFLGTRTWEHTATALAARTCSWTQAVFEVDDAPRYESFGYFKHEGETSTWTSQETWRPLPRREYTVRRDYDVVVGTNVHVMTKDGWRHEQANTKLVLATMKPLVREKGLNSYVRTESTATERAQTYLRETGPFWAAVRSEWMRIVAAYPRFTIDVEQGGEPLFEKLFPLADASAKAPLDEAGVGRVQALVRGFVKPAMAPGAAPDKRAASNNERSRKSAANALTRRCSGLTNAFFYSRICWAK